MHGVTGLAFRSDAGAEALRPRHRFAFTDVIDQICGLRWEKLHADEVMQVAKAYYYFSVQFRENLQIACRLYPADEKLQELSAGECDTDNLSPFPGIAAAGERLDHDEFMRRLLVLQKIDQEERLTIVGQAYLDEVRRVDEPARATSIASYEDQGLSRVFEAMLRAPDWRGAGAGAFKFFLEEHIRFDSDDDNGHGALSRHLQPDDKILPLWLGFRDLMVVSVPGLAREPAAVVSLDTRSSQRIAGGSRLAG